MVVVVMWNGDGGGRSGGGGDSGRILTRPLHDVVVVDILYCIILNKH